MVQKSEKTAVPVLIPGLFNRSRSRTVDTLVAKDHWRILVLILSPARVHGILSAPWVRSSRDMGIFTTWDTVARSLACLLAEDDMEEGGRERYIWAKVRANTQIRSPLSLPLSPPQRGRQGT